MANKTQNPAPVMDAPPTQAPATQAPKRGRPPKDNGNGTPPADSSARTKAFQAAKQAVKNLGPAGPTADVVLTKAEIANPTGWALIMGDIQWSSAVYTASVNGEHLGTFT